MRIKWLAAHILCMDTPAASRANAMPRAVPPEKHGTWSGYAYYKCRCEPCVAALVVHDFGAVLANPVPEPVRTQSQIGSEFDDRTAGCNRRNGPASELRRIWLRHVDEPLWRPPSTTAIGVFHSRDSSGVI